MDTNTMIKRALDQGTLVIMERGTHMIIGQMIKVNGGRAIVRVIISSALTYGERVSLRVDSITRVTPFTLAAARTMCAITGWADMAASPSMIILAVRRHYLGWSEFAAGV